MSPAKEMAYHARADLVSRRAGGAVPVISYRRQSGRRGARGRNGRRGHRLRGSRARGSTTTRGWKRSEPRPGRAPRNLNCWRRGVWPGTYVTRRRPRRPRRDSRTAQGRGTGSARSGTPRTRRQPPSKSLSLSPS
jgi:hypothetical protein